MVATIKITKDRPLRVTFDTNACNILADPVGSEPRRAPIGTGKSLLSAIADGRIRAFISEASVFIECLSFPEKLTYLSVMGTWDPRPEADERAVRRFKTLAARGAQMLHAPLVGAEIFIDFVPWATDDIFPATERIERFGEIVRLYPVLRLIKKIGNEKLRDQPPVPASRRRVIGGVIQRELRQKWGVALKRAWDGGTQEDRKALRKHVAPLISEWCDVLIVASHYAYRNDFLCTIDIGKEAKKGKVDSIMDPTNLQALEQKGVNIISPTALCDLLGK
jgi:hypothetical protein